MREAYVLVVIAAAALLGGCDRRREAGAMGKPKQDNPQAAAVDAADGAQGHEKATFAAGCFWGVEATFQRVPGVVSTCVGYTGGHAERPTYKQVCTDRSGHAEAVRVIYDPAKVTFEQLLDVFWACHDPTQLNRQGPDVGTQYRSAVFHHSAEQQAAAEASKAKLEQSGKHSLPIATEITPAATFWKAEEYHQRYLEKRGGGGCHLPQ